MGKKKELKTFLDDLLSRPMEEIDKEYMALDEKFFNKFGYMVPRAMIPDHVTDEQLKTLVKKCLELEKDVLFETLGIEIKDGEFY